MTIRPSSFGDFGTRFVTGIAAATLAFSAVWAGGLSFAALVAVATVLVFREWRMLTRLRQTPYMIALALLAGAMALGIADIRVEGLMKATAILTGGGLLLMLIAGPPVLGTIYVGLPAITMLWLRALPFGLEILVWILSVVIATDVFAYLAGRSIGGRKLAPAISPGKTWSGLAGGIIAAEIIGWLVAGALKLPPWLGAIGGLMALLAQAGDLFESWLKRRAGVKDSGSLLPGHGGLFDRIDGLLPVAVATAIAILIGMTS